MSGMSNDVRKEYLECYMTSELCKNLIVLCLIPLGSVKRVGVSIKLKPAQTKLVAMKTHSFQTSGNCVNKATVCVCFWVA